MNVLTSIPSYAQSAIDSIRSAGVTAYTTVEPIVAMGIQRIQDLWTTIFPALEAFAKFSMTRTGSSIDIIALAILPFALSKYVADDVTRVALVTAGVFMLSVGAYLLSGLPLPALPFIEASAPV